MRDRESKDFKAGDMVRYLGKNGYPKLYIPPIMVVGPVSTYAIEVQLADGEKVQVQSFSFEKVEEEIDEPV